MSFISSIFTLKPIVDILHEDAMRYVNQIKELQDRIVELEKENRLLKEVNSTPIKIENDITVIKEKSQIIPKLTSNNIVIDDTVYAKEAEKYEEPVNVVVENTEKVVVVNAEKSRKEYQQEYQRQYRKHKKEKQQQVTQ
jgi:hypothetical protein